MSLVLPENKKGDPKATRYLDISKPAYCCVGACAALVFGGKAGLVLVPRDGPPQGCTVWSRLFKRVKFGFVSLKCSEAQLAQIDQTTAPLIGALIAAAVALIVGLRSSSVAQASGAADRKIAKMRMDWLRDLRALLAQYVAALIHRKPEDHSKVEELRADLRLMLNLSTEENKGEKLHEALWKLAEKAKGSDDRATREALAEKIENVGRGVLKATWDQIKSEVHGGAKPGNIALIACGLYLVALIPLFLIGYVTDTIGHSRVHQTAVYPATWLLGVLGFEGYRRDEWDAFLLCVPLAG